MRGINQLVAMLCCVLSLYACAETPILTPPSGATAFTDLQDSGNGFGTWTQCNSTECSGSGSGVGTSAVTFGVSSPSLSGASMEITSTSTSGTYFNTLTYIHLGCGSIPGGCVRGVNTYFLTDLYFYIPSTNVGIQALEFDPDLFDGTDQYLASQQCDSASGDWRFWNMASGSWETSSYTCGVLSSANTWHHYQLLGYFDQGNQTYAYVTFVLDGTVVYSNLQQSYSASSLGGTATYNTQVQIGGNTEVGTNVEYLDDVNEWVW